MSTADKLQQLRLERQKSDLSHKLQALQAQLERAESEKSSMAAESGNKIKQALSLLDTARKEIDKLKKEKEALTSEVTDLRRQNTELRSSTAPSSAPSSAPPERNHVRHTSSSDDANLAENTRLLALQENTLNGTVNSTDDEVVVRRQKNEQDGSERPMSMAERMSMFESKPSGGRSFGNGPTTNGIGAKRGGWKNAQPQVKLAEEKPDDKAESSPVTRRSTRVSQHAKDNRHTMPPNMFSPKQISSERKEVPKPAESKPAAGSVQAASGRDKMRTALGGMMAAIETEKQHKGMWKSNRRTEPKDLDKLLLDNLETFDKTSGTTPNSTHKDSRHHDNTLLTRSSSRPQTYKNNFAYSRTSSKSQYDEIEEQQEDSDPELRNLVRDLKSNMILGSNKMFGKLENMYEDNVSKYEHQFISKSESLCDALNKIDALNIKEENKQFLIENIDDEPYYNPLEPHKYRANPQKLDTSTDKHSALRALMKKRHDFSSITKSIAPTRIFDKAEPSWRPTGLVKVPVKSSYDPTNVVKGETTEKYASFTRSGMMSPQERVMENIKNLREGDDTVAQIRPSIARNPKYVPPEEEDTPIQRPRGLFTPKLLKKPIVEPPRPMLLPENSSPAPFTYMNAATPVAELSAIKARKEASRAPTNPKTSDDAPLTKGVKRGSVKNLAAMFNGTLQPKQGPSRRTRRLSEGSTKIGAMKPGLIKSKSLVFENDSGSVGTGISTNDLTCSTKYTDNTDRDVDTSIMDDTGDSDLYTDKMLIPHTMSHGYHFNQDVLPIGNHDDQEESEEDDRDFLSSGSLSRAVSPVLKSRRGSYGLKKRNSRKVESSSLYNDRPTFSDSSPSESSPQLQAPKPIKVFDKEIKKSVAVKPDLSTIMSQRSGDPSRTNPYSAVPATSTSTTFQMSSISNSSTTTINSSRPPFIKSKHVVEDVVDSGRKDLAPLTLETDDQFDLSKPPKFDSDVDLDCSQSSSSSLKENDCLGKAGDGTKDGKFTNGHDEFKKSPNEITIISDVNSSKIPFSIAEYQKMFAKKQENKVATTPKTRAHFTRQQTITPHTNSISSTTRTTLSSTPPTRTTKGYTTTTTTTFTKPRGLIKCSPASVQPRSADAKFGSQPKPQSKFVGLVNDVAPKNPVKRAHSIAAPGSAGSKKAALLHWCQRMTEGKAHVDIRNFGRSWNDGMAFCALFHHFIPDQIPYDTLDPKNREFNFHLAFTEGEKAGVTALLDVEDMVEMLNPDWRSVMTYISLIYNHFNGIRVGGPRLPPMPGQE